MSEVTTDELPAAIVGAGVRDDRVIAAFEAVSRAAFVPATLRERAARDEPIPIPHGQVTTQPSLIARILEALELGGHENILEVGTGFGFQTARFWPGSATSSGAWNAGTTSR